MFAGVLFNAENREIRRLNELAVTVKFPLDRVELVRL